MATDTVDDEEAVLMDPLESFDHVVENGQLNPEREPLTIKYGGKEFCYHLSKRLKGTTLTSRKLFWILLIRAIMSAVLFGITFCFLAFAILDVIHIFINLRLTIEEDEQLLFYNLLWFLLSGPLHFAVLYPLALRIWHSKGFLDAVQFQQHWIRPVIRVALPVAMGLAIIYIAGVYQLKPPGPHWSFRIGLSVTMGLTFACGVIFALLIFCGRQDKWSLLFLGLRPKSYAIKSQHERDETAECIYVSIAEEKGDILKFFPHITIYLTVRFATGQSVHCYVISPCRQNHRISDSMLAEVDSKIVESFRVLQFVGKVKNVPWKMFVDKLLHHLIETFDQEVDYNCRHVALEVINWCRTHESFDQEDHQSYLDVKQQLAFRVSSEMLLTEPKKREVFWYMNSTDALYNM